MKLNIRIGIIFITASIATITHLNSKPRFDPVYEMTGSLCSEITGCTSVDTGFLCSYMTYDGYYRLPNGNNCNLITLIAYERI